MGLPQNMAPATDLPEGAPTSNLFEVRQTPYSGRAVFATQDIPADTVIYRAEDLAVDVVFREYRREVCGMCFGYDRGRDLRIRDQAVGFAFCSEDCRSKWRERSGDLGIEAWTAVEKLVKGRSKEDSVMVDIDLPRPKIEEVRTAWESVLEQAALIRIARAGTCEIRVATGTNGVYGTNVTPDGNAEGAEPIKVTKQHRKALQKALTQPICPDIMTFCVSGLLWKYNNPQSWGRVVALADDNTPYHNFPDLQAFTRTYLHLLAILPMALLPEVTPQNLILLSTRDSHNSFGIRSLEDGGSEYFGYGCWPSASYFNHSCGPNIEKNRIGSTWYFRAAEDIEKGREICITYLSGEERSLSRDSRMKILKKNWGFDCGCTRCEVI